MTAIDCAAPTCRGRHHLPDCSAEDCRGCAPRPAGDGKRLCELHEERLGSDARDLAQLYDELALRLVGGQGLGDKVSGSPGARLPDQRAVDARTAIRHTLVSWCLLVSEERGFTLPTRAAVQDRPWGFVGPMPMVSAPDESLDALAAFLGRSAPWLAAHPAAGECSDELSALRRLAWSVAYPSGTRTSAVTMPVTGRPAPCIEDGCPGMLRALLRPKDRLELPSSIHCDGPDEHSWPSTAWHALGRRVREQERAIMEQTPEVAA